MRNIGGAEMFRRICLCICLCGFFAVLITLGIRESEDLRVKNTQRLHAMEESILRMQSALQGRQRAEQEMAEEPEESCIEILPEYQALFAENSDLIGWLSIEGTQIDYPVMQTPWDENYYLQLDFEKKENVNGSLIMDTDSVVGVGYQENDYANGTKPSTNLIIHGHHMKSGMMFGDLDEYRKEEYGKEHNIICFDSLYEHRTYEVLAIFYSRVYYENEDVFKYYKFFQADTEQEFQDFYDNIRKLSLYDTGVTAQFGDEFITLSTCAYHVEDGRFVVVAKRIQ